MNKCKRTLSNYLAEYKIASKALQQLPDSKVVLDEYTRNYLMELANRRVKLMTRCFNNIKRVCPDHVEDRCNYTKGETTSICDIGKCPIEME